LSPNVLVGDKSQTTSRNEQSTTLKIIFLFEISEARPSRKNLLTTDFSWNKT